MDISSDAHPTPEGGIKVVTEVELSVNEVQSIGAIIEALRDLSNDSSQAFLIMTAQRRGTMQDAADLLEKVFRVRRYEGPQTVDPLTLIKGGKS